MSEPNVTAAQIEMYHKMLNREWTRLKQNPSSRMSLVQPPGKLQCYACKRLVDNVRVCSACKMIVFCSPECAKTGWRSHKPACATVKRDGERIPQYKAVIAQFPWTAIAFNTMGQFNDDFVLIQFGLLGTSRQKVGYWATHERRDEAVNEVLDAPWSLLSEEEGWRLPTKFIPSLALDNSDNRPSFPPTFEDNWKSYYNWRGLPMESPAAMMLQWPLAVYVCLKELGFASEDAVVRRRKLKVFYLGARDELCFLPVFGELALLFPNTDLDLVVFGQNTGRTVQRARTRGLALSSESRPCVFEYTAPATCGSGTLRIFVDSAPGYYRPSRNPSDHPDALVALNAGLGTYISWQAVILLSAEFDIPFAVTDYSESCLGEAMWTLLRQGLTSMLPPPKGIEEIKVQGIVKKAVKEVQTVDVEKVSNTLEINRPAKFNGFMGPGLRVTAESLIHGGRNGVIQVIVPGAKDVEAAT
ncbi:hypothetical protein B0H16DRAFT_1032304 [Mycena metata]|uniref:MYND-type domain-containing protein n=1 Tax=Mycena metata TaxID=1033252 RepID=A0AAD7N1B6_9AGAR|nr:hypothetical protein B0H16DRAFT_1032304 [Mycena metata]